MVDLLGEEVRSSIPKPPENFISVEGKDYYVIAETSYINDKLLSIILAIPKDSWEDFHAGSRDKMYYLASVFPKKDGERSGLNEVVLYFNRDIWQHKIGQTAFDTEFVLDILHESITACARNRSTEFDQNFWLVVQGAPSPQNNEWYRHLPAKIFDPEHYGLGALEPRSETRLQTIFAIQVRPRRAA